MKLREFALLTDENLHPDVVGWLVSEGFNVLDVCRDGLQGAADRLLLQRAFADSRVIVTHDSDFGVLTILQGEPPCAGSGPVAAVPPRGAAFGGAAVRANSSTEFLTPGPLRFVAIAEHDVKKTLSGFREDYAAYRRGDPRARWTMTTETLRGTLNPEESLRLDHPSSLPPGQVEAVFIRSLTSGLRLRGFPDLAVEILA